MTATPIIRVNVGCGQRPTPGWVNFDNSPSVALARWPLPAPLVNLALNYHQREFYRWARDHRIHHAPAQRLPLATGSADVVYSSHMLEHLDREVARKALAEFRRILKPGGTLRLALPDLSLLAERYRQSGDADAFMEVIHLVGPYPRSLLDRIKIAFFTGWRHHLWMYDGATATALVSASGFTNVRLLPPGRTDLPDPGDLDLHERAEESLYLEATRPAEA